METKISVELETTAFPTMRFGLAELAAGGEPSPLVRLLRPRIRVLLDGRPFFTSEPAGPPEQGVNPLLVLGAIAGAALVLYLVMR